MKRASKLDGQTLCYPHDCNTEAVFLYFESHHYYFKQKNEVGLLGLLSFLINEKKNRC